MKAKKALTSALKNNGYDGVILKKDVGSYADNKKNSYSLTGSPNELVTIPQNGALNRSSNNRIAQNEPSVNNNSMQDSKEYSMPSETDTDYTAEMDALDERFKNR